MVEVTVNVADTEELTIITGPNGSLLIEHDGEEPQFPDWEASDEPEHSVQEGEYYIDDHEPTPSPEANTVRVTALVTERADEFVPPGCDKPVADFDTNRYYPDDDLVVAGTYPNMSSDQTWHFPESRLR